jgi:hypothetical protein
MLQVVLRTERDHAIAPGIRLLDIAQPGAGRAIDRHHFRGLGLCLGCPLLRRHATRERGCDTGNKQGRACTHPGEYASHCHLAG